MSNRSNASTPPVPTPAKELVKQTPPKANGTPPVESVTAPTDKGAEKLEKEKQKRKDKKERKDREKREAKEAEEANNESGAPVITDISTPAPKSGRATPAGNVKEASTSAATDHESGIKSPTTESTGGARTPTSKRGQRNPWTLFMRMNITATEDELRDFYGEAKGGIIRVNIPPTFAGRANIAYVEFGDEEAMKVGLEKHAEVS